MTEARVIDCEEALHRLPVLITHLKPVGDQEARIMKELNAANPLHLQLIFPAQAVRLDL